MSTSGPLLPTVSQGDSGDSPLESARTHSSQERVPSLTSSSVVTHNSPSKFSTNERNNEKEEKINLSTSLQRPQSLPVEEAYNPGCSYTSQQDPQLIYIGSSGRKNECLRSTPSGDEKANASREWNATYSEMFQDEGGGDGLAFVESDDDAGSTPPAVRWAKSLRNLLEDEVGAKIFRAFLLQELRSSNVLDFWYACKGLRENESGFENISDVIQVIWKKFIRKQTVKVSRQTYKLIEARIDREPSDPNIFDQAQYEVEKEMNETLYRAFLESDLYLSYLLPAKKEVGVDSPPTSPIPFDSCCPSSVPCSNYLPTLHEDSEFDARGNRPPRLTSNNLLASATYRAHIERIKPEGYAGYYLKGSPSYNPNPYHVAYVSGHTVSLQDSERQSLSSGAHTDDTKSCTDSSLDASSLGLIQSMNSKQLRRQNQKIKESAMQNKDTRLISSISGGVHVRPRTMMDIESKAPRASSNPVEFMKVLTEKLEKYQQEKDSRDRLKESINKMAHSEGGAAEEIRREHAVNALPPNVLLNKLSEKVQLDDQDPSQSILDEHVARVWDSPGYSPGSPKQILVDSPPHKTSKGNVTKQLPHLSYPNQSISKSVKYHNAPTSTSPPSSLYPNITELSLGARGRHPSFQGVGGYSAGYFSAGYQPRNMHQGRRKERGQDVNSTFSSDSGNVADYHDCIERLPPSYLPKSKSMPEYIENQAGGTIDSAHRRYYGSGTRRYSCRRTPADFTDSGVSVVSDSGRSGAPSSSSERVESWLFQHCSPSTNSSYSVCPGGEREFSKEYHKVKGSRSTHTMAGSTSPGTQRKLIGNSGRRSQSSSSTSANTCINARADGISPMSSCQLNRPYEMSRDSPLGQAQPTVLSEKKKIKGGSSSGKSTGHSSSFEGSGSNGSTLKGPKSSKQSGEVIHPSAGVAATGVSSPSADVTTIVYSFQDDHVPFIIKVPSRPVTLKRFKQHLHKKGSFRYFFKKFCEEMGMVYEELTDDSEILPFFEGKVFVQIHKDD